MTCKRKERNRQKVDNIGDCNIKVIDSNTFLQFFFQSGAGQWHYKALSYIIKGGVISEGIF